ncbi:MAG: hypothetical protein MHMPM18_000580 [Marteilia pararefringens]
MAMNFFFPKNQTADYIEDNIDFGEMYQQVVEDFNRQEDYNSDFIEGGSESDRYRNIPARLKYQPVMPNRKYINASLIDLGSNIPKSILSQAPMESTIDDFYEMCIANKVTDIVMLCNIFEKMKIKTCIYFPQKLNSTICTEGFTVTCLGFENHKFGEHRLLGYVRNNKDSKDPAKSEGYVVSHYWFRSWPDFGVSDLETTSSFLEYIFECFNPTNRLPIIHCSAGVGRSGTLALAAIMIHFHIALGETLNERLFRTVFYRIRERRYSAVQTTEQLLFAYKLCKYTIRQKKSLVSLLNPEAET